MKKLCCSGLGDLFGLFDRGPNSGPGNIMVGSPRCIECLKDIPWLQRALS